VVTSSLGYLDLVDEPVLLRLAGDHDVRIEVLHPLGAFLPEGAPLAIVHGQHDLVAADWLGHVEHGLLLARERTMEQDLSFAIRRLVDIAERALSPGVNDPTTAAQVVDELHDVLRRMVGEPDRPPVLCDDRGVPRLVLREHGFSDCLDLAVDEIAHYGADDLQVPRRLGAVLLDLEAVAAPEHREAVAAKAARLRAVVS
jgi:uncharacterized membrane protein